MEWGRTEQKKRERGEGWNRRERRERREGRERRKKWKGQTGDGEQRGRVEGR